MILKGKNVVLGVTGGIAAYKAVDLCSKLVQAGANVDVIMTPAATKFVTPLPFQTISQNPVSTDMFQLLKETDMAHISLSKKADVIVIAPATANTIAKLAHGMADNLLTTTVLASPAPLVIAPAMDADMWANPRTQANVRTLVDSGVAFVGPGEGRLASGRMGRGRLVSTEEILAAMRIKLGEKGPLAGQQVVVTAGGTQEPLDPVRHLGNRSSGKMGYALAIAARDAGAHVTLISAPCCLEAPYGVEFVPVRTAAEMHQAVLAHANGSDILFMAAAVADYRPAVVSAEKMKKTPGNLMLELERTPDILASVAEMGVARPRVVVGFAAETENVLANAQSKLARKKLDMIVANDVSVADSGFGVDTNRVTLLTPDGQQEELPLLSKEKVAERIIAATASMGDGA